MGNFLQQPAERSRWQWWQTRKLGPVSDLIFDVRLRLGKARHRIATMADACLPQRILIVGVVVPGREDDMEKVQAALLSKKHHCHFSFVTMQSKGKFDNVNDALEQAGAQLTEADWIMVVDDDIGVTANFVDNLIGLLVANDVDIAQPAHRMFSHTSWLTTKRYWGSLLRQTKFVEIGPVTVFRRSTFAKVLPFPSMRWAWGMDPYWSHLAMLNGWTMAIVDAVPIRHLRPVGKTYDRAAAEQEGDEFLNRHGIVLDREEIMGPGRILMRW